MKTSMVVRCNNNQATPYLRRHLPRIATALGPLPIAFDLGAGNLRNTNFARSLGWWVMPLDVAGDFGSMKVDLGSDHLPCGDNLVDLFLCNYVMCFLSSTGKRHLISEIKRTARLKAYIVVEMYQAKNTDPYDTKELTNLLGWNILRFSKDRFIARNY